MATRPKVHRSEVARAILAIAKRRAKVDDPDRDRLPDSPDSDPREILDYLRRFSGRSIPRWVLQAEVCDALTLNNWLWWEDRRRELYFLKAGRDRGLFLAQIGAQVGVGKEGVVDRIDRLEALLRYDRPDEKISRTARTSDRHARERRPAEDCWLDAHHIELLDLIGTLIEHAARYGVADEDREWLDELVIEGRLARFTPATMVILGLAVAELRTAPAVLELDGLRPHAVHHALGRADHLRSSFAECGPKDPFELRAMASRADRHSDESTCTR